ncbi:GDP-mannose 4,6-dehydratase [Sandarakinorhabdus sp. DWP1-3-1]|uniref:GDP-mannose 4,6-dehydratase n=1 Tax=Sandarakinorhabdus sp. DWP1-3-1 TaxID=2804627 RepID=UPI003CF4299F
MAALPYASALILGVDDHVGAYLARLLDARGVRVTGVKAGVAGPDAIAELGIGAAVALTDDPVAAAAGADVVFAVAANGLEAQIDNILAAARPGLRIAHVVDRDRLQRDRDAAARARRIAEARAADGRPWFNAILHPHDSRLGPTDNLAARITAAAWRASRGEPERLELVESGPQDWGWTPEYVDAVLRLAALPQVRDAAVATGHTLTTAEFAGHAFEFFGKDAADHVTILPGTAAEPDTGVAAAALKAATGWSASTWGRDLVRALGEGAAGRR